MRGGVESGGGVYSTPFSLSLSLSLAAGLRRLSFSPRKETEWKNDWFLFRDGVNAWLVLVLALVLVLEFRNG